MDLDEVAHDEPPHQDLPCLQIKIFLSLVVKELTHSYLETCKRVTGEHCRPRSDAT